MNTYPISSPAVIEELEELVNTTGLSVAQIIEIALIKLFGDDNNFISCPSCGDRLVIKNTLKGEQPVEVFTCGCCGTSVSYDTDKDDIVYLTRRT
jgi:hypothetical protein